MFASLLDEAIDFLIGANKDYQEEKAGSSSPRAPLHRFQDSVANVDRPAGELKPPRLTTVTAELNIKYRRHVPTGTIVLVRAWFDKVEGSKVTVQAAIEDSDRRVLSAGRGLFVGLKPGEGEQFQGERTGWAAKI